MRIPYSILICLLFSACAVHTNNWCSNDQPGQFNASFAYFNGKESHPVQMNKDDILFIDYAIAASGGTITLSVTGGNQELLWRKQISGQGDTAGFHITAPTTGQYKIIVSGAKAKGGFAVNYTIIPPKKVQVITNRNIELFGLLMQLDDGPEILQKKDTMVFDGKRATMAQWYGVTTRNYEKYKRFDTCRVMHIYQQMETAYYSYHFFMGFLLQVDQVPFARINNTTDKQLIARFSAKGDSAEALQKATAFLDAFNAFYYAVNLEAYLANNKPYYDNITFEVTKNIPNGDFLPVMEHYYRKQFNQYNLVPSLNIFTDMGFGILNQSTHSIYNTFGPFSFQSFDSVHPDMGFDNPEHIRALAAHEFGHSFANPAIDSLPQSLIDETAYLYEPVKQQMKKQAYISWRESLYEHLVRAGEVIVAEKIGDSARAITIVQDNLKNGFIYLPFMIRELREWDKTPSAENFNEAVLQMMLRLKKAYKPTRAK